MAGDETSDSVHGLGLDSAESQGFLNVPCNQMGVLPQESC